MSTQTTIAAKIPEELRRRIEQETRWLRCSAADIVRRALEEYFINHR